MVTTQLKLPFYVLILTLAAGQTACLKTRAQLKNEQGQDQGENEATASSSRSGRYEVEEFRNEVTRISGKLEELEHNQRQHNAAELKEYVARLDGRVAELEKNQLLLMSEVKALKDKEASHAAAAREAAVPVGDQLSQANQLLAEKKCDEAVEKFKAALSKNLKDKLAADAHFGLGESYYCLKDYKKAIVQYSKVQEASGKSPKIPSSLYRIGLAFQHLNMTKESRGFFSELIERYPKTPEAKKARAKVKE